MVWAIPFIVMSNNWGNCRIMTNQKKDTIWTHWGTHKLHYRSLENAYRGVGLRRKRSKNANRLGYLFHSHTAHSIPLPHHFPPQTSPSQALSIHIIQLSLTRKRPPTLLPSILLPILITKDIESLPKNSREYPSPELPRLPLVFLPILKKLPNSPKTTTDYSLLCHSEHKELHRLSLKWLRFPLIYPKISPSKWNNHPQISTFI